MQINRVPFIGKGGVGLLYGSMIAKTLGNDAVEYIMDDARFERHAGDALTVNDEPCALKSVRVTQSEGTETTGAPARDRGSGLRQCR